MERFSLSKYLANPSRKVVTRGGNSVRILCTDAKLAFCPIIALIERDGGKSEYLIKYKEDGIPVGFHEANNTLFFAPEKHEGWVSIHRGSISGYYTVGIFDSEEKAKERAGSIATVKVEWEE